MGLLSFLIELRQARDETIVRTHLTTAADQLLRDRGYGLSDVRPVREQLALLLEGYTPQPAVTVEQLLQDPFTARLAEHQWALHLPLNAVTVRHRANRFIARLQDLNENVVLSDDWLGSTRAHPQQVWKAANVLAVYNRLHPHEREAFLDLVAIAQQGHLMANAGERHE